MNYDLENAIERGDIFYDENQRLHKEIDRLQESYDQKCEQLRERDEKLAAVYNLLRAHNLDGEDLTKYGYVDDSEEEE